MKDFRLEIYIQTRDENFCFNTPKGTVWKRINGTKLMAQE